MYYKYPNEYFYPVVVKKESEFNVIESSYRDDGDQEEILIYDEMDEEFASAEIETKADIKEN